MAETAGNQPLTIVAFGDSITQAVEQPPEGRWPELVRRALQNRFPTVNIRMINAGIGGNTSREGLARIEPDVLSHRPRFVLAEFGNDATPEPERHVSVDEFADNLRLIRARVAESSQGELILLTFPPIIDAWHAYFTHEFYRQNGGQDAYQEHYRKRTREFANASNCPLVDVDRAFRGAMLTHGPEPYILRDGVHLTARGNQLVADVVVEDLSAMVTGKAGER